MNLYVYIYIYVCLNYASKLILKLICKLICLVVWNSRKKPGVHIEQNLKKQSLDESWEIKGLNKI